jgi:hypothetical protein
MVIHGGMAVVLVVVCLAAGALGAVAAISVWSARRAPKVTRRRRSLLAEARTEIDRARDALLKMQGGGLIAGRLEVLRAAEPERVAGSLDGAMRFAEHLDLVYDHVRGEEHEAVVARTALARAEFAAKTIAMTFLYLAEAE